MSRTVCRSLRSRRLRFEGLEDRQLLAVILDPNFGNNGIVSTDLNTQHFDDTAAALAVQTDGKIVMAGTNTFALSGDRSDIVVVRYNPDGTRDKTFGVNGETQVSSGDSDFVTAVVIQNDGKIVIGGGNNSDSFMLVRLDATGNVDNSFDTDGFVRDPFGMDVSVFSLAVDDGGLILAAGSTQVAVEDAGFAVARFELNGALDASFGTDGLAAAGFGTSTAGLRKVLVQADDKIVLAGFVSNVSQAGAAIARFNTNGSLDTTFDGDGKVLELSATNVDAIFDIVQQADGKLVASGGFTTDIVTFDTLVRRFNANGSPDTTFDGDGRLVRNLGTNEAFYDVAVLGNGQIVVGGLQIRDSDFQLLLGRINANGTFDTSFAGDGIFSVSLDRPLGQFVALVVQPTGIIVGTSTFRISVDEISADFVLYRFVETAPTITSFVVPTDGIEGQKVRVSGLAHDAQGPPLTYQWTVTGPGGFTANLNGSNAAFIPPDNGTYTVTLTARLNAELASTLVGTLTVVNAPPTITRFTIPLTAKPNRTIALRGAARDPAGVKDTLVFTWLITTPKGSKRTLVGAAVNFNVPATLGTYRVKLTVTDGDGGTVVRTGLIKVAA